jgi:hypothetical protein
MTWDWVWNDKKVRDTHLIENGKCKWHGLLLIYRAGQKTHLNSTRVRSIALDFHNVPN